MSATVEITEKDGVYTAVDAETGERGTGESRALALAALAVRLHGGDEIPDDMDPKAAIQLLSSRTQARFDEEGVSEDDVEDAVAWARE